MESLETEYEQSQADLQLAFKRIADLQAAIEDDLDVGSDENSDDLDRYSLHRLLSPSNFDSNLSV